MSVKIALTSRAGAAELLGGGQGSFGHRDPEYTVTTDSCRVIKQITVTLSLNDTTSGST